ncbi:alpha/beta fold hydrolase [Candidatus Nitrosocosmicus franklandus]|uniref:2-hydroxy-6-oxo-6-(2'-aminophenyl)hexa-2, 4-dienoic acid hydrolase n=1 Tax=Candidatus Nitrosocosmicus franklandianus TaxID=1798806 RepID=A0A484I8S8_9ARCH|nr:alpha/beta hydrolase [Candidatus Nitrosocosmicus franklandus]VFJ13133.1 2-hydroxy-6-oxo-6-(2'-aminophenyl)hexa-2, 4-dienoic acid hydrolase [Candidatus Nitrosocosmicus franklandus]
MYKTVNGMNIKYDEYGTNNKDHILFIHGLGSSSLVWRDIPEALSSKFHSIVIDLVGSGESDKPKENYTISFFSKFVKDFINEISISAGEKISIIGHSLGGYIALDFALRNKEKIDKLILFDSSGLLSSPTPLLVEYHNAVKTADANLRRKKITKVLGDLYAHPSRLLPIVVDLFIYFIEKKGAVEAFESAYAYSTSNIIDVKQMHKLSDLRCLILWGEKDKLIPISYAEQFKKHLASAELEIIKDAGHAPFVEKPAIVYQILIDFLK